LSISESLNNPSFLLNFEVLLLYYCCFKGNYESFPRRSSTATTRSSSVGNYLVNRSRCAISRGNHTALVEGKLNAYYYTNKDPLLGSLLNIFTRGNLRFSEGHRHWSWLNMRKTCDIGYDNNYIQECNIGTSQLSITLAAADLLRSCYYMHEVYTIAYSTVYCYLELTTSLSAINHQHYNSFKRQLKTHLFTEAF